MQGVTNQSADARSHCRWQESRQLAPNTQPCPASMRSPLVLLTDLTSWFRTAVLLLSYSWPGSLDLAFLCVSPSEIHFLLLTAWQLAPVKVSMLNGRMDALSNLLLCFWPGLSSICWLRLIYQALELSTWIRGAHICLQIVSACRGTFMASSAVRVLLRPCGCL